MTEPTEFDVTAQAGRKGTWRVSLSPEALTLTATDDSNTLHVMKTDAEERIILRESRFMFPVLIVQVTKMKREIFKLDETQLASLRAWVGPPTFKGMKLALKQRLRWCLPIGIFITVSALPLPANPDAGTEAVPFDPVSAALGISLIGLSIIARWWPRRIMFLLDAIWFLVLAADTILDIGRGGSLWWSILVVILVMAANKAFSEYRRFASVSAQQPQVLGRRPV